MSMASDYLEDILEDGTRDPDIGDFVSIITMTLIECGLDYKKADKMLESAGVTLSRGKFSVEADECFSSARHHLYEAIEAIDGSHFNLPPK